MPDENSAKLQDSDILSFTESTGRNFTREYTYKYKNFKSNFKLQIENGVLNKSKREYNPPVNIASNYWFDGIECELLRDGVEKKGKIRVILEFVPKGVTRI